MNYPGPRRTLRFVLICLTLVAVDPISGLVSQWRAPISEIAALAPPAAAQSGGYRRPGGGFSGGFGGGGYSGGYARRPSIGGGYSRPSSSAFGGGFGSAFGGRDLATQLEPGPARLSSLTRAATIHHPSTFLWLGRQHLADGTLGTPAAAGRMGRRLCSRLPGVHAPLRGLGCVARVVAPELIVETASR